LQQSFIHTLQHPLLSSLERFLFTDRCHDGEQFHIDIWKLVGPLVNKSMSEHCIWMNSYSLFVLVAIYMFAQEVWSWFWQAAYSS